jgi:hypothetical protein
MQLSCCSSATGKQRGVVATAAIKCGQLVMEVPALALLQGEEGHRPEPDELVGVLAAKAQDPWLKFLRCKDAKLPLPLHSVPEVHLQGAAERGPDLSAVVATYAFGDEHDELLCAARGGYKATSQVGLWAPFGLLNHSCAPNTVHYVVKSRMVVRAVADIAAGEEVTVSYLAREALAPKAVRCAALADRYDFDCQCPRCVDESQLPAHLASTIGDLHSEVACYMEGIQEAVDGGRTEDVRRVYQEALNHHRDLHAAVMQHADPSSIAGTVRLATYSLHELLFICCSILEDSNAVLWLCSCLKTLEEISAGDELHVYMSCKLLELLEQEQPSNAQQLLEKAQQLCGQSHLQRYGELDGATLASYIEGNREISRAFL